MSDIQIKPILTEKQQDAVARIQKALLRVGELQNDINALMSQTRLGEVLAIRVLRSYPGVRLYDAGRLHGDLQNLLMQHDLRSDLIKSKGGAA